MTSLVPLLLWLASGPPAAGQPTAPVVVISIDGMGPGYVLEADRYGLKLPNLRRFLKEGAFARGVKGVLPTVTYASHTTLVTGVSPARHGILYNEPFDPLDRNKEGWYWNAEDLRVPTLWDAAREAGLDVALVDWPVTVGARARWCIPQFWRTDFADMPDDSKLSRLLATPGLLAEAEAGVGGAYPSGYAYDVPADRRRAAFDAWILQAKRPRLQLSYFSALDEELHDTWPGSPRVLAALEELDALVGKVRAAAEAAGGGRAVVAVVSDHSHSRTARELRLNEALRQAGLVTLDGHGRTTAWKAIAWGTGGSAAVMLKDPKDDATRRAVGEVLKDLAALPDTPIQRILTGAEARAAGGFPEAAFVVGVKLDVRISSPMEEPVVASALPAGEHGHLPENPEMDASFLILGPGVPVGRDLGRIDMRDVAPTLAGLLGVGLSGAEGRDLFATVGSPR
jgi:predicted AlkP superfamily pyrophosphatase or phosphodiesterase